MQTTITAAYQTEKSVTFSAIKTDATKKIALFVGILLCLVLAVNI